MSNLNELLKSFNKILLVSGYNGKLVFYNKIKDSNIQNILDYHCAFFNIEEKDIQVGSTLENVKQRVFLAISLERFGFPSLRLKDIETYTGRERKTLKYNIEQHEIYLEIDKHYRTEFEQYLTKMDDHIKE